MSTVTLIGIDLGKHSFHLHGQDAAGRMMFRKKCSRQDLFKLLGNTPRSTVVMEACAGARTGWRAASKNWATRPSSFPQFVRPFVQGNKNDFADAQAICEAASRPSMRFVSVRNQAQQTVSALHRVRESLVAQRTGVINQVHAFCWSLASACLVVRRSCDACQRFWPNTRCRPNQARCWSGCDRTFSIWMSR